MSQMQHRHDEGIEAVLKFVHFRFYREAKKRNPERWTGNIRNWDLIEQVDLNPDKEKMINKKKQPKLIVENLNFER